MPIRHFQGNTHGTEARFPDTDNSIPHRFTSDGFQCNIRPLTLSIPSFSDYFIRSDAFLDEYTIFRKVSCRESELDAEVVPTNDI